MIKARLDLVILTNARASQVLKSTKVTNEDLALSNCVFVNAEDFRADQIK